MPAYVYILECIDGYLYTGITWNIKKRIVEHQSGETPFTKNRLPVTLIYLQAFASRQEAALREKEIKGWSRQKKLSLSAVYVEEQKRRNGD